MTKLYYISCINRFNTSRDALSLTYIFIICIKSLSQKSCLYDIEEHTYMVITTHHLKT